MADHDIPDNFGTGGSGLIRGFGSPNARDLFRSLKDRVGIYVANAAELAAIEAKYRSNGQIANMGGKLVQWLDAATDTDATDNLIIEADDAPSAGAWCVMPGQFVDIPLAFTFSTADAAVLYTTPAHSKILIAQAYWEIAVSLTGGSSSAIGLSSGATGYTTKGDVHGGASGDVAASLTAGTRPGTAGAKKAAGILLPGGSTILYDKVTSAFTAGSGNVHVCALVLANPGV